MTHQRLACYIPAYNPGDEFIETLSSVARSTLKPYVIVVDDASAAPIKVDFAAYGLEGEVIRLPQNSGHFKASNIALRELHRRGFAYVARLDADDMVKPERFARQVEWLDTHPEHLIVASAAEIVDGESRPAGRWPALNGQALRRAMARNSVICHPTVTQRGDYIETVGPYRELRRAADYEYLLRAVIADHIHVLEEPLLDYRVHQKSLSFTSYRGQLLARLATQRRYLAHTGWPGLKGMARTIAIIGAVSIAPPKILGRLRERFGMSIKKSPGG